MFSNGRKCCSSCKTKSVNAHKNCDVEYCADLYSTEHHLLFCKQRVQAFKHLFLPKIDNNLFSRFGDLFELDEKYFMLATSSTAADFVNLPNIKLPKDFFGEENAISDTHTMVIVNKLSFYNANIGKAQDFFDSINSKEIICMPRKIYMKGCSFSPEMVLQLLTPYTKEFEFRDSHCVPNLNFADIIKNAPNIESIVTYNWGTNIQIDKTWPEDLLKYKKGKNFRNLSLKFGVIEEFNIEKLKEFIRTKCTSDITIYVRYDQDLDDEDQVEWEKMDKIIDKLNQYFDDTNESPGDAHIWIGFDGVDGYHTIPLENYITPKVMPPKVKPPRVMPTRVMPSRAATKRRYV